MKNYLNKTPAERTETSKRIDATWEKAGYIEKRSFLPKLSYLFIGLAIGVLATILLT